MNELLKGKITLSLIMIIAVVATAVVGISLSSCRNKETIKIGAILSLSGPGSYTGKEVSDGMLLAVNEINSRGGIDGRKIELIIVDSKTDTEEGKQAFTNIEANDHPVLYVSTLSSISMALAPLAAKNEVVLTGLVAAAPELTKQNDWVYRYYPTARNEVPPIMYILQQLGVHKLGILYLNDEYGGSVFKLLKEEAELTGRTVESQPYETKDTDFKEKISRLKDQEAIYTIGFVKHLKEIFPQLKISKYSGYVLASEGAATLSQIEETSVADGLYLAAAIIHNPDYLFAREVKEKYALKYDKPLTHQAANGWDFVKLIAGLLEDHEVSRENVKSLLDKGFIYSGVFGTLDVQPGEHDIAFPLHPAQIADGEIKYLR